MHLAHVRLRVGQYDAAHQLLAVRQRREGELGAVPHGQRVVNGIHLPRPVRVVANVGVIGVAGALLGRAKGDAQRQQDRRCAAGGAGWRMLHVAHLQVALPLRQQHVTVDLLEGVRLLGLVGRQQRRTRVLAQLAGQQTGHGREVQLHRAT